MRWQAVEIRPNLPEAIYALRRAVSSADWTSILRLPDSRDIGLQDVEFSERRQPGGDRRLRRQGRHVGHAHRSPRRRGQDRRRR